MKTLTFGLIVASLGIGLNAMAWGADVPAPLVDDFQSATQAGRRAERGAWKIEGGVATCTQDDELYKKLKNHGPVIWHDLAFDDAVIRFAFKSHEAKSVVFTINGAKGHVFRTVTQPQGTSIRAFPPASDVKSLSLETDGPALKDDVWTSVSIELRGEKAIVKIGDEYVETVSHPTFATPKTTVGVGFSFGTVSIKDFAIEPIAK